MSNVVLNFALNHTKKKAWNTLSSLFASFSFPVIKNPVTFTYHHFVLKQYDASLPPEVEDAFVRFCYPLDLPNRENQIECDRRLYWNSATTFLVFNRIKAIVGCVQILHRSRNNQLPIEFAQVRNAHPASVRFDLSNTFNSQSFTEMYRCRRSFDLNRIEATTVLLMLFKAIHAHVVEQETSFSFISYDYSKHDLHNLYVDRLDFKDTGINLQFTDDPTTWRLLKKDWYNHEKTFAAIGTKQFLLQTWCRQGLLKKHISHRHSISGYLHDCNLIDSDNILFAETFSTLSGSRK